ncbi:MAG: metallophosphoesterase [Candidatus Methylomirabilales bacterium]
MRILALSDLVDRHIYSPQPSHQYREVDLVVGCGDLPFYYLEHAAAVINRPVIYVHGNHDAELQATSDGRYIRAARGCTSIDGEVKVIADRIFVGLGGSIQYIPGAHNQYTELAMRLRVARMLPRLLANKIRYGRYLDVLVTHAAPYGVHDGADRAHVGFRTFRVLIRFLRPKLLLHGHMHNPNSEQPMDTVVDGTRVVGVFPVHLVELDPP